MTTIDADPDTGELADLYQKWVAQQPPLATRNWDKWNAEHPYEKHPRPARGEMPQLHGYPKPGSPADSLPKDEHGKANVGPLFEQHLKSRGITVTHETVDASTLAHTQHDLNQPMVDSMAKALKGEGGFVHPYRSWVSADNQVLDGHHRLAAHEQAGVPMRVTRAHMPMSALLAEARQFTEHMGMQNQTAAESGQRNWATFDAERAQWFHGTKAKLKPGDILKPGSEMGTSHFNSVSVASHPGDAKHYAGAEGHVYRVTPLGPLTEGRIRRDGRPTAYTPSARVEEELHGVEETKTELERIAEGGQRSWAIFDSMRPKKGRHHKGTATIEETAKPKAPEDGWKPNMTLAEAETWAKDSKIKAPLYHGTFITNASSIKAHGFQTKRSNGVSRFGTGAYLSNNKKISQDYAGHPDGLLQIRVNITNPASVGQTSDLIDEVKASGIPIEQMPNAIREAALAHGYDALSSLGYSPRMGDSVNYVVFDPRKVTVIR